MSNYNLRDLLRAINIMDKDTDVTVDSVDSIAVCPPVKMTQAALRKFKDVLALPVEDLVIMSNDDADYDDDNKNSKLDKARFFLTALAGYCSIEDYEKWFDNDEAVQL